jgi:flagellar motor switch protein FliN
MADPAPLPDLPDLVAGLSDLHNPFASVPIEVTISVGRARPLVRDLLRLKPEAVLVLDRRIDDPVELYVGDRLIARGELEELDGERAGQLAVRLTEVAPLRGL